MRARSAAREKLLDQTGDASDRRYFRILLPDAASIVLSLHGGFDGLSAFAPIAALGLSYVVVTSVDRDDPVREGRASPRSQRTYEGSSPRSRSV